MTHYKVGDTIPALHLQSISGETITVPDTARYTHLQFRRFAGCPVCTLHMAQLRARHDDITKANIREVIVFYSEDKKMSRLLSDLPFDFIADPKRKLYAQFGVRSGLSAILSPRVWMWLIKGAIGAKSKIFSAIPSFQESMLGLPADFLITPSGEVCAVKYGTHAYDQWSVDELLSHVPK